AMQQAPQPTRQSIGSDFFQDIAVVKKFDRLSVGAIFPQERKKPDTTLTNRETCRRPHSHHLRDESTSAIRDFNFGTRLIEFWLIGNFPSPHAAPIRFTAVMKLHSQRPHIIEIGN
ncbi:MAG: hypothetical protein WBF31_15120, partial [Anaerolineae bacterium]